MNNGVYSIIKLENFKEYLNQRMVSPRLLNNPRFYEILNEVSDEFSLIHFDEEMRQIFDKQLLVGNEGIAYLKDKRRVKIIRNSSGIETISEQFNDKDSSVSSEKRLFDNSGIEYLYEIRQGQLSWEDFKKYRKLQPNKRVRYARDDEAFNFIIKEEIDKIMKKEYLIQQVPFMLQNLKLTKKEISRISNGSTIDDLCGALTKSQVEYDLVKKVFNEDSTLGQEEIFKTYCDYNKRFSLPTTYEKAIAIKLKTNIEKNK